MDAFADALADVLWPRIEARIEERLASQIAAGKAAKRLDTVLPPVLLNVADAAELSGMSAGNAQRGISEQWLPCIGFGTATSLRRSRRVPWTWATGSRWRLMGDRKIRHFTSREDCRIKGSEQLTLRQVAAVLSLSVDTVRRMVDGGRIRVEASGLVSRSWLEDWLYRLIHSAEVDWFGQDAVPGEQAA